MHVLQLLSCVGFHGAEAMTAELSRQLSVQGVQVDLAVLDNAGKGDDQIFKAVGDRASACHRLPCDRQIDLRTLAALRDCIRSRGIDVVHSHSYKTTFYAALLKPFIGFRLVATYHNWLTHTRALQTYAWVDKKLARFVDGAVGVSTPVVRELGRHVSAAKVMQIDNGIDVDVFVPPQDRQACRQALGLSDLAGPVLGFVGRLSPEKGLHHLLPALTRPGLAQVQLLLAGDGPERQAIESQITALGLGSRVRLLGYRRDTLAIYHALDALVLPSTLEAFPMVLLEAMATGLPVIASAVGEIPRIVNPACGWLTGPGDTDALAHAMQSAFAMSADQRALMARAARARVVEEFSSATMARRYVQVYRGQCPDGSLD